MNYRLLTAAALLLLCAATAHARILEVEAQQGRQLLQAKQPNCTKVDAHCSICRNQRIPGERRSELVCSQCDVGYRLRRDGISKTCDCAPGLAMNNVTKQCQPCSMGKYCLGGDLTVNPNNEEKPCPEGLETTFAGAKSQAQCFTKPGYGRAAKQGSNGKITLSGVLCPEGSYNVGSNTAGCQKCGAGLTTANNGSDAASACMAPAGSYMDKGIGKICQRGTYSTALSTETTCQTCPPGITTANEGSTSAANCSLAMKGFYINPSNTSKALQCDLNYYQDEEAATQSCKACPNGWKTKEKGATGVALCLAPPGYELKDNATQITLCPTGSYKADWNRNPCVECGTGLITKEEGSVSKDACLVPAGWGLTTLSPNMIAERCSANTYGDDVDRPAASNARCTPCPTDLFTMDTIDNRTMNDGEAYVDESACLVKPGWGTTATTPRECPIGTWNQGKNRQPCHHCATGWTTLAAGKTAETACVIQPGWVLGADNIPAPCDKGSYSIGGTESARNGVCTPCGASLTTQEDEATSAAECNICAPGYGGDNCGRCDYGTYAAGGAINGSSCAPCASGSTSKRGASQSQQCYSLLIDARSDVFQLDDESKWVENGASAGAGCGAACVADADCVMYKFVVNAIGDGSGKCYLLPEVAGGSHSVGFKIGNGDDYSVWSLDQSVGAALSPQPNSVGAADTEEQCKDACTAAAACEVYTFTGTTCTLAVSDLEQDQISMFHVRGDHLYSDLHP